ncbi:MAG TPA: tetratricopeptide repeat protein, partial [Candidatus Dormibacteraeota bacterium]|nr:tetratricopeptide repeat protein [Candidatus Dormibacteraeota bacterium]
MSGEPRAAGLALQDIVALSALDQDAGRLAYLQKRKLLRAKIVSELNDATLKEFRANTQKALMLAEAAILVAKRARQPELVAQSLRVKANVLTAAGQYQEAIHLYDAALEIFTKKRNQEGIARTLTAVIQPHIMLGTYENAFAAAERARKILTKLGDSRRLARLENNIGNIYHRQDRFAEALTHYERGYQGLLPHADSEELTISLNNMSMCLIGMNDFTRARETYEHAKELLKTRDLPLIHLITDYNVAYLYYLRGDYRKAIEMLKDSRVAAEKISYKYLLALCHLDLSDIYIELNLSEEAKSVAGESCTLFREMEIGYEAAKALANQAIAYGQDGKTRRALELFAEARTLFESEKNDVWPWLIDLYQAIVLFHEGRDYEARRLALAATAFFDHSFLKNKAVVCHFILAQIAIRTGDVPEARRESARALELVQGLNAPILSYQAHFLLGRVEQAAGDLPAAYQQYQFSRTELESLRSNLGRDELKISFMKNKVELYERLVEICLDESFAEDLQLEAFRYIELAKSRSLTEIMLRHNHSPQDSKPGQSELVHKIRDLREELNWYQHRIELEQLKPEQNSAARIEQLRTDALEKERQILHVLDELPVTEAESAAVSPQAEIALEAIRPYLDDHTTLLEYFYAGDKILAAVVTNKSLEITTVTNASRVTQSLRMLRFQLGKFQINQNLQEASSLHAYRATVAHLSSLYGELIAPLRPQLSARHLVIVPHGILHYLPFQALHDGEAFLADSYEISYSPSAAVYALCHARRTESDNTSLVLGVPDAHAPMIREEAEAVHEVLPNSELFLGEAANHHVFLERAKRSRIIHVATHGS